MLKLLKEFFTAKRNLGKAAPPRQRTEQEKHDFFYKDKFIYVEGEGPMTLAEFMKKIETQEEG